jgi:3',5'-cyclic AMP phosphodiesterase CpdA
MKTNGAGTRKLLITASLVMAGLALGCGEQNEKAAIETSAAPAAAVEKATPAVVAATATSTPESGVTTQTEGVSDTELPPDVTAEGPDSLITPGNVVEIMAQASTDATSLMLMDGLGHRYPMVYDVDAKAWRVKYRVPLTTHIDRLGLSVTATNGSNRFKRIWVFLKIEGGVPAESDGC